MAKEQTEDELNLRRKARRRLVGAVALTLAVVVILPMVLDSEPKPAGQDIDLRIPAPDNAGKFAPGVAASGVPGIAPLAASAAGVAPVSSEVQAVKKNDTAGQAAVPGKQPVVAPNPKKEAPAKAQHAASGAGFVVQVGAYSNAAAAKQELNKLKKWGFKAYTEKAGEKVRVRVGPYAEREKAEKASQLLEKHGLKPVVMSVK
ncbi:MAG: SPOR domain-containing protein [Gallionella sp.]|nr:SPOR domain-containing protein [Gallionella sp.]MDH4286981.1 SPOR domain-containing protein [Gallionella sp.]